MHLEAAQEVPVRCQQSHFTDQGTTAWLDQSEAASWLLLGLESSQEKQPEPLCFLHTVLPQTASFDLEVFSGNPMVRVGVAIPSCSGEGIDWSCAAWIQLQVHKVCGTSVSLFILSLFPPLSNGAEQVCLLGWVPSPHRPQHWQHSSYFKPAPMAVLELWAQMRCGRRGI